MEKRNYFTELTNLENDIINEIKEELLRLNRDFTRDDEDNILEFFNFDSMSDLQEIKKDGSFIFDEETDCSIHQLISNGDLNTWDIISLLNELRNI